MQRKLFGLFSGAHITIMVVAAVLAPTVLVAVPAFQNVAILDANTGAKAYIDPSRRLWVYDPVAGYRNYPGNVVNISFNPSANTCYNYVVPSGKALIIAAASGYHAKLDTSGASAAVFLYDGAGCSGTDYLTSSATNLVVEAISVDFGSGITLAAGKTLSLFSSNDVGLLNLHAYLVPAGAVPTSGVIHAVQAPGAPASTPADKAKARH